RRGREIMKKRGLIAAFAGIDGRVAGSQHPPATFPLAAVTPTKNAGRDSARLSLASDSGDQGSFPSSAGLKIADAHYPRRKALATAARGGSRSRRRDRPENRCGRVHDHGFSPLSARSERSHPRISRAARSLGLLAGPSP